MRHTRLQLGPLGGLGAGDVGAVERAEVDQETSRPARWIAAWAEESTFWVSAIGTGLAVPEVTSSWPSGRRPSTRSLSTSTTMPSSKRSTGAAGGSGCQKAVAAPAWATGCGSETGAAAGR